MRVRVLLFAVARERAGAAEIVLDAPADATVGAVFEQLARERPALADVLATCRAALDEEFAPRDARLRDGQTLAVLPPVSGGSGPTAREPYGVTPEPLDLAALVALVADPAAGAIASFLGTSRATSADAARVERPVLTLWYECYEPMAVRRLRAIGEAARARHGAVRVACWHRTGEVPIGAASIAIAVSAPHRAEAFAACRDVIDEVKRSVPVWKRERFADGSEWVEGHAGDVA